MKTINETFTDEEFATLLEKKGNRSWHDYILDLNPDPKKNLVNSILFQDNKIATYLSQRKYSEAIRELILLLHRLDTTDNEFLTEVKDQINFDNYDELRLDQVVELYKTIHAFLNETYYAGFKNAKPKEEGK